MDFHGMKRRALQALCKKHNIPANLTNSEMADKLSDILKERERLTIRGRSCLKTSAEVRSENDSEIVNKQSKKVKFSPDNEVFEFQKSDVKSTRRNMGRRRSVRAAAAKNSGLVVNTINHDQSKEAGALLFSPAAIRQTRRGSTVVKGVDTNGKAPSVVHLSDELLSMISDGGGTGMPTRRSSRNRSVLDNSNKGDLDADFAILKETTKPAGLRKRKKASSGEIEADQQEGDSKKLKQCARTAPGSKLLYENRIEGGSEIWKDADAVHNLCRSARNVSGRKSIFPQTKSKDKGSPFTHQSYDQDKREKSGASNNVEDLNQFQVVLPLEKPLRRSARYRNRQPQAETKYMVLGKLEETLPLEGPRDRSARNGNELKFLIPENNGTGDVLKNLEEVLPIEILKRCSGRCVNRKTFVMPHADAKGLIQGNFEVALKSTEPIQQPRRDNKRKQERTGMTQIDGEKMGKLSTMTNINKQLSSMVGNSNQVPEEVSKTSKANFPLRRSRRNTLVVKPIASTNDIVSACEHAEIQPKGSLTGKEVPQGNMHPRRSKRNATKIKNLTISDAMNEISDATRNTKPRERREPPKTNIKNVSFSKDEKIAAGNTVGYLDEKIGQEDGLKQSTLEARDSLPMDVAILEEFPKLKPKKSMPLPEKVGCFLVSKSREIENMAIDEGVYSEQKSHAKNHAGISAIKIRNSEQEVSISVVCQESLSATCLPDASTTDLKLGSQTITYDSAAVQLDSLSKMTKGEQGKDLLTGTNTWSNSFVYKKDSFVELEVDLDSVFAGHESIVKEDEGAAVTSISSNEFSHHGNDSVRYARDLGTPDGQRLEAEVNKQMSATIEFVEIDRVLASNSKSEVQNIEMETLAILSPSDITNSAMETPVLVYDEGLSTKANDEEIELTKNCHSEKQHRLKDVLMVPVSSANDILKMDYVVDNKGDVDPTANEQSFGGSKKRGESSLLKESDKAYGLESDSKLDATDESTSAAKTLEKHVQYAEEFSAIDPGCKIRERDGCSLANMEHGCTCIGNKEPSLEFELECNPVTTEEDAVVETDATANFIDQTANKTHGQLISDRSDVVDVSTSDIERLEALPNEREGLVEETSDGDEKKAANYNLVLQNIEKGTSLSFSPAELIQHAIDFDKISSCREHLHKINGKEIISTALKHHSEKQKYPTEVIDLTTEDLVGNLAPMLSKQQKLSAKLVSAINISDRVVATNISLANGVSLFQQLDKIEGACNIINSEVEVEWKEPISNKHEVCECNAMYDDEANADNSYEEHELGRDVETDQLKDCDQSNEIDVKTFSDASNEKINPTNMFLDKHRKEVKDSTDTVERKLMASASNNSCDGTLSYFNANEFSACSHGYAKITFLKPGFEKCSMDSIQGITSNGTSSSREVCSPFFESKEDEDKNVDDELLDISCISDKASVINCKGSCHSRTSSKRNSDQGDYLRALFVSPVNNSGSSESFGHEQGENTTSRMIKGKRCLADENEHENENPLPVAIKKICYGCPNEGDPFKLLCASPFNKLNTSGEESSDHLRGEKTITEVEKGKCCQGKQNGHVNTNLLLVASEKVFDGCSNEGDYPQDKLITSKGEADFGEKFCPKEENRHDNATPSPATGENDCDISSNEGDYLGTIFATPVSKLNTSEDTFCHQHGENTNSKATEGICCQEEDIENENANSSPASSGKICDGSSYDGEFQRFLFASPVNELNTFREVDSFCHQQSEKINSKVARFCQEMSQKAVRETECENEECPNRENVLALAINSEIQALSKEIGKFNDRSCKVTREEINLKLKETDYLDDANTTTIRLLDDFIADRDEVNFDESDKCKPHSVSKVEMCGLKVLEKTDCFGENWMTDCFGKLDVSFSFNSSNKEKIVQASDKTVLPTLPQEDNVYEGIKLNVTYTPKGNDYEKSSRNDEGSRILDANCGKGLQSCNSAEEDRVSNETLDKLTNSGHYRNEKLDEFCNHDSMGIINGNLNVMDNNLPLENLAEHPNDGGHLSSQFAIPVSKLSASSEGSFCHQQGEKTVGNVMEGICCQKEDNEYENTSFSPDSSKCQILLFASPVNELKTSREVERFCHQPGEKISSKVPEGNFCLEQSKKAARERQSENDKFPDKENALALGINSENIFIDTFSEAKGVSCSASGHFASSDSIRRYKAIELDDKASKLFLALQTISEEVEDVNERSGKITKKKVNLMLKETDCLEESDGPVMEFLDDFIPDRGQISLDESDKCKLEDVPKLDMSAFKVLEKPDCSKGNLMAVLDDVSLSDFSSNRQEIVQPLDKTALLSLCEGSNVYEGMALNVTLTPRHSNYEKGANSNIDEDARLLDDMCGLDRNSEVGKVSNEIVDNFTESSGHHRIGKMDELCNQNSLCIRNASSNVIHNNLPPKMLVAKSYNDAQISPRTVTTSAAKHFHAVEVGKQYGAETKTLDESCDSLCESIAGGSEGILQDLLVDRKNELDKTTKVADLCRMPELDVEHQNDIMDCAGESTVPLKMSGLGDSSSKSTTSNTAVLASNSPANLGDTAEKENTNDISDFWVHDESTSVKETKCSFDEPSSMPAHHAELTFAEQIHEYDEVLDGNTLTTNSIPSSTFPEELVEQVQGKEVYDTVNLSCGSMMDNKLREAEHERGGETFPVRQSLSESNSTLESHPPKLADHSFTEEHQENKSLKEKFPSTFAESNMNSPKFLKYSAMEENAKASVVFVTPNKRLIVSDMKENAPIGKKEHVGSVTAAKSTRRRPLENIQKGLG